MHAAILLAAAAIGVDYGWQPLDTGGFEYLIQVEPELLDALRAGEALRSDVPAHWDIRSYRITVGRERLPRVGTPRVDPPVQPPVEAAQQPPIQHLPDPPMEQPPADSPRHQWSRPTEDNNDFPRMKPPGQRYPDYNLRSETPKPQLPAEATSRPNPLNEDAPGRFQADPAGMAMIKRTSAYGLETKPAESKKADGTATPAKASAAEVASKPWLPLTATLFGLFISLGGNAYLGMQWWSIRSRCQQMLRDRRIGAGSREPEFIHEDTEEAANEDQEDDQQQSDEEADEDQDVRAITEDELPRNQRRRSAS